MVAKPVVWFGEDADRALWAVIISIVWKVIGFGMLLFVAAIQAIPGEINEAAMVDGASYWQRVRKIILPLTPRTILLVTLVSVIGSLLAFDQFFLMTAGQPFNQHGLVGLLDLSQLLPLSEARLRRGAVADPRGDRARLHRRADAADPAEPTLERGIHLAGGAGACGGMGSLRSAASGAAAPNTSSARSASPFARSCWRRW